VLTTAVTESQIKQVKTEVSGAHNSAKAKQSLIHLKPVLNVFFSLHHSNCLYLMNTKWYLL